MAVSKSANLQQTSTTTRDFSVPLFRNAFYWFIALAGILVLGFWNSYFAKLGTGEVHWTHHFHAIAMLGWVGLLITQSWLIRNRHNARHRAIGKWSFVIAPIVVVSAVAVNNYFPTHASDPMNPDNLGIFFLGYFTAALFALLYVQAIRHRRNMQLHARYMVVTALVFLMPGLARAIFNYIAPLGVWVPSFYQMFYIPLLIGLGLMAFDLRRDRPWQPFAVFSVLWAWNLAMWVLVQYIPWWRDFTAWMAQGGV